jgi:hypothetical protein
LGEVKKGSIKYGKNEQRYAFSQRKEKQRAIYLAALRKQSATSSDLVKTLWEDGK